MSGTLSGSIALGKSKLADSLSGRILASRVTEMTLAHVDKNAIRDAYNRAQYLDQRRTLLQDWANAIDAQCEGAKVVPIKRKKA